MSETGAIEVAISNTSGRLRVDAEAELARLRAVDEAWRAVREKHETQVWNRDYVVSKEVETQIARLDQLKGEVRT